MWGSSIAGLGSYHYKYASGHEGEWMLTGFSPRKDSFSLYTMCGVDKFQSHLKKLGKHKTGKSYLYIKSLDDVNVSVLKSIIKESLIIFSEY